MPPLNEYMKYYSIKQKVLRLFKEFFYGETITPLESDIEMIYLQNKENKWKYYQKFEVYIYYLYIYILFIYI